MLDTFRQLRHGAILFVLVALTFGIGDKTSLCIMPDGAVHLEQDHSDCQPSEMRGAAASPLALHDDQVEGRARCLDVSLDNDATSHQYRLIVQVPAPAAVPQGPPLFLASTDRTAPRTISAAPPQQLLSLRSIVLLI